MTEYLSSCLEKSRLRIWLHVATYKLFFFQCVQKTFESARFVVRYSLGKEKKRYNYDEEITTCFARGLYKRLNLAGALLSLLLSFLVIYLYYYLLLSSCIILSLYLLMAYKWKNYRFRIITYSSYIGLHACDSLSRIFL